MDKTATELYCALDEIMKSVGILKTYSGTALTPAEKQIVDNNFRFIEQRGGEAMRVYTDARAQELSAHLVKVEEKG